MNKSLSLKSRFSTDMLRVDIYSSRIIQDRRMECYWKVKLWQEEPQSSPLFHNEPS